MWISGEFTVCQRFDRQGESVKITARIPQTVNQNCRQRSGPQNHHCHSVPPNQRPGIGQKLKGSFLPGVVFSKGCEFLLVSLGGDLRSGSGGWGGGAVSCGKK